MNILKSPMTLVLLMLLSLGCIGISMWPVGFTQISIGNQHCRQLDSDFSLQWRHSVEKTKWLEHYQRQKDHFILLDTELVSFGAGTPSNYPVISLKEGVLKLKVNQKISQLSWYISTNMQGRIISDKNSWQIYQDFPDYTLVQFSARQAPLWQMWRMETCP